MIIKYPQITKIYITIILLISIPIISTMTTPSAQAELIVLASTHNYDPYYKQVEKLIFNFHIQYAKQIIKNNDHVIILTTKKLFPDYVAELGKNRVAIKPMLDIWIRDFSLANTTEPILFRYSASAQGAEKNAQKYSDQVQQKLLSLINEANLSFSTKTNLINDGGNFVDDYHGNVVISTKFLKDNKLSENQARKILTQIPTIKHVAFINADQKGGLEHADGIVSFVDKNTLIINSYPKKTEFSKNLISDLKRGLPNVKIYPIVTPYNHKNIYDKHFGSACGLYTNALVTTKNIYLPQFGIKEDKIAIKQISNISTKKIVPVRSENICSMGGSVRCMAWQLRGQNSAKLINLLKQ